MLAALTHVRTAQCQAAAACNATLSVLVRANCVTWSRNGKWVILIPVSTFIGSSFIIKQFQGIMIGKVTSDALQPNTMMEQAAKNSTFMAGYI